MNPEIKNCQNCKKDFTIEVDDFSFYAKIKVPPPTFCSDCRTQRRMMFRNERVLYKRNNNATGQEDEQIISIHRPDTPVIVYDDRTWWGDSWDAMDYGLAYDFNRNFFEQFKDLYRKTPLINLSVTNNLNCTYCNVSEGDKACHMLSGSERNEDTMYGNRVVYNKQSSDLYICFENELCYELVQCTKCYKTLYSINSQECSDSYFLLNCKNCVDCIGCVNLRNKSRCIFNEQYSKIEYEKLKNEFKFNTVSGIKKFNDLYKNFCSSQFFKYANNIKSEGSTGDNLLLVAKSINIFDMQECENIKNCTWGMKIKDSLDSGPGIGMSEMLYEVFDMLQNNSVLFSVVVYNSHDIHYSINCHGSSHLFGCYGLRSKNYCILNRQYSKEEYEEILPKIIEHMKTMQYVDNKGRIFKYGEFFPYDISPFAYNETIAQEYFPLTEVEARVNGFDWYERDERNYQITININSIPESISEISDDFVNEIVQCEGIGSAVSQCTKAFRITQQEIELYRKLNIPIPTFCLNCRHYNRLQKRNPMRLWHRSCMCDKTNHEHSGNCTNEFETSYSPDRPETIYCEKCYQQEVV